MPKVKVNDRVVEVPPGTSAMDAIFHAGYDVPLFCAERHLSPTGSCRMCLVKAGAPRKGPDGEWITDESGEIKIFWFPKLMASCTLAVSEGMVIDTLSDEVRHAQSGMVELTLANHPLDCPTCDKGGACDLQDRAYEYGLDKKFYTGPTGEPVYTRYEFTKRHVDKHHPLSEFIILDRERCIHCKRCVRYFEEIPGDEVLDFIERGVHTFIGTADEGLPSNFTGNITDICPVGALLDRVARFRGRNWEFEQTPSVSPDDASGQYVWIDARSGRIERIRARENPEVNDIWISDAARFGHEWADMDRVTTPLVRKGGSLEPASWEEALAAMKQGLEGVSHDQVGILLPGDATLEEGMAAAELARRLGTGYLDFEGRTAVPATSFPAATFADLLEAGYILAVGDPTEELPISHIWIHKRLRGVKMPPRLNHGTPVADLSIREHTPPDKNLLGAFAPYPTRIMRWAGARGVFPPGHAAAFFAAFDAALAGREPTEVPGVSADAIKQAAESWRKAEKRVMLIGAEVLGDVRAAQLAEKIAKSQGAGVLVMTPAANARGLEAMGVWTTGKDAPRAAFIAAEQPPAKLLQRAGFKVFHAARLTPVVEQHADVVLPAKTAYEKLGTYLNAENRLVSLNPAHVEAGEAEGLTQALYIFGQALGAEPPIRFARQARSRFAERYKINLDRLDEHGVIWRPRVSHAPRPAPEAEGAALYLKPSMWKTRHRAGEAAGRALGELELAAHPETAQSRSLDEGARIEVVTPAGPQPARLVLDDSLPKGWFFLPALGVMPAARLPFEALVPEGGEAR
jgi:NADH-quinone oxidoreductase subunit G